MNQLRGWGLVSCQTDLGKDWGSYHEHLHLGVTVQGARESASFRLVPDTPTLFFTSSQWLYFRKERAGLSNSWVGDLEGL